MITRLLTRLRTPLHPDVFFPLVLLVLVSGLPTLAIGGLVLLGSMTGGPALSTVEAVALSAAVLVAAIESAYGIYQIDLGPAQA